jgi:hypothetical protein
MSYHRLIGRIFSYEVFRFQRNCRYSRIQQGYYYINYFLKIKWYESENEKLVKQVMEQEITIEDWKKRYIEFEASVSY